MVPLIISFFKDFFVKSSGLICSLSTFLLHVDRICRLAGIHQNFHIYVTPGIIASYIYKVSFSHVALFWKFGKVVESHPRWNYFMENLQKKGIYKACFPGNFPSFSEQMFFKESLYDCSVILSRNSKIWHTFILIFVILSRNTPWLIFSIRTVLMEAVSHDYCSIAHFLLKNKADIYLRDGNGKDVKSYATNSKRCLNLIESYDYMKDAVDKSSRNQGRKYLAGCWLMSQTATLRIAKYAH